MKKWFVMITMALSFLMVLGMAGCDKKEEDTGMTIDKLYAEGYSLNMSSLDGDVGTWKAYYIKDGDWSQSYLVEIPMSQDEFNELFNAETDEEQQKMICSMQDIKITNMKDQLPAEDEINKYVGKTLSEMEEEGYYVSGSTDGEDGNVLVDCTKEDEYVINVAFNEDMTWEQFNEDNVDYSKLTVKEARFAGFGEGYVAK